MGEDARAAYFFEQGFLITRELGDRRGQAAVLAQLGTANIELGNYDRAVECCEKALRINGEIAARREEAEVMHNLGDAYFESGETSRAIEYYEQALTLARDTANPYCEEKALCSLGIAFTKLRNPDRAEEFFTQLPPRLFFKDWSTYNSLEANLGRVYLDLGEVERAIECLEVGLTNALRIGNRRVEKKAWKALGHAYEQVGKRRPNMEFYKNLDNIRAKHSSVTIGQSASTQTHTDDRETRRANETPQPKSECRLDVAGVDSPDSSSTIAAAELALVPKAAGRETDLEIKGGIHDDEEMDDSHE